MPALPSSALSLIPQITSAHRYAAISGLAEPVGVLLVAFFYPEGMRDDVVDGLLAGVGGIMAFLTLHELMPLSIQHAGKNAAVRHPLPDGRAVDYGTGMRGAWERRSASCPWRAMLDMATILLAAVIRSHQSSVVGGSGCVLPPTGGVLVCRDGDHECILALAPRNGACRGIAAAALRQPGLQEHHGRHSPVIMPSLALNGGACEGAPRARPRQVQWRDL